MTSLRDPSAVREEYADESRLAVRANAWGRATGPDSVELYRDAVAALAPRRVLEVGCGRGETAAWIVRETGADVIAIDQSDRMVELTRERGIDARVGDVQDLPFEAGYFDCVVAAWMLFHVADLERGLAEIARVLRPGGQLVAVTNSERHCRELKELMGASIEYSFSAENGEAILRRYFAAVERREADGYVIFQPDEAIAYIEASKWLWSAGPLPELDGPIRVTKAPAVFVATK